MKFCRLRTMVIAVCSGLGNVRRAMLLDRFMQAMLSEGCLNLLVDFQDCTGVDSSFVGTLVGLSQTLSEKNGVLIVNRVPLKLRRIFKELGVWHVLVERTDMLADDLEFVNVEEADFSKSDRIHLIRHAHERLLETDAGNQERFGAILETIREEASVLAELEKARECPMHAAMRECDVRFRLIFENVKEAIFWANTRTGIIINCNRAAEELLEKERREIIGLAQTRLHPPEKARHYADVFRRHIRMGNEASDDAEVITKTGIIRKVHIYACTADIGGISVIQGIFQPC